jgi:hypothetical protein
VTTRVLATYRARADVSRERVVAVARGATGARVWVADAGSPVDVVACSTGAEPHYDRPVFEDVLQLVDAWVVHEVVQWDDGGFGADEMSILAFERRKAGVTRDEFVTRYRDGHGPLAREHHPGMARYVQRFVVPEPGAPEPAVDAVAELTFRSAADRRDRFYATPDSQRIVLADVDGYMDRAVGWSVVARPAAYAIA